MIHEALEIIIASEDLSRVHAEAAMEEILSGHATDAQIAALLIALRMKGETVDELVDTCGTGGDARGTFNVSTAAAFVVAGAGVPVAKHGNRSISSKCGSADVLEHLGVKIDMSPEATARAIIEIGIGFLFAPAL